MTGIPTVTALTSARTEGKEYPMGQVEGKVAIVAVRLEGLAAPGDICTSARVQEGSFRRSARFAGDRSSTERGLGF
jgi:class 3 adenylate cyclase